MSHDYTFISDLNSGMGGQGAMQGGMGMQQMYPQQQQMQQQMYPQQMQGGMQGGGDQYDMIRKYLAEANDSDSDADSDDEYDSGSGGGWGMYYQFANLILLAIILYYVYKIRKEITGMYEEA